MIPAQTLHYGEGFRGGQVTNDPQKPFVTSGIRLGTSAGTTRGFREAEFELIGGLILRVIDALSHDPEGNAEGEAMVREAVCALCADFPIYSA
ncbi:hypothetical protein CLG85_015250 [Yangia mangrovi]|uniref:Serine hydroxymethyltransferase-like domain-containing protein n=1 Tax=Alloyangia mangrovi TaxID=1779329 RepID=A0ABT2KN40_9RHOB|nr:hypothetical protein [Alloyangia mangrovi]